MNQTFLITGFEPFDGGSINNSWEIAQKVCNKWATEQNPSVQVVCERLPVSWSTTKGALIEAVKKHNPRYLLSLGLAASTNYLRFEAIARNEAGTYPDNEGKTFVKGQKTMVALAKGKPLTIPSTLPQEWLQKKFPDYITISTDAEGYLCNYVFYQNMINFPRIKNKGFIHVCNCVNNPKKKDPNTDKAVEILFDMIKHMIAADKLVA